MRNIIIRCWFIIISITVGTLHLYGQAVEENQEVRTFLDNMFEPLDKSRVPHGLLRDFAFELVDMDHFDGSTLNETNTVDRQTYEMLLRTIRSSAVTTKPFEDVGNILVKQYNANSSPNTITISALAYQYSVIKANALTDNLIQYNDGKVSDNYKNGIWQNPYETRYVIGFCGQDSVLTSSSVSFKFDSNCWFTNLPCRTIEIDTGSGYRAINIGSSISENYTTDGTKDIKLRITLTNGKQLLSHTKIQIIGNTLTRSLANDYHLNYPQAIITGDPYRGLKTKAEVFVAYAPSNHTGRIKKPFIVVEGFDPRIRKKDDTVIDKGSSTMANFYKNCLRDKGIYCPDLYLNYDIVYVDWDYSEEYIQANANTLIKVIQWVNAQKDIQEDMATNVILGQSMGGVITRYALRKMEDAGMEHQVSLYISHDAPHLGANVPLGALYALYGLSSFLENQKTIGHFADKYADSGTLLTAIEKIAHSHAAKQLLVNYVDYGGELNNSEHYIWQNELAALGFPRGDNGREFRMLAIANGSYFVNTLPTSYLKVDFSASSDLIGLIPLVRWLTSPVLAWGLNDIWVGLLNLVPGKTTIKGLIEINPGTSFGGKVTDINLRYVKKCLWLIDVRHTIFSYTAHINSNLLYDTYPSSYYDLSNISDEINGGQNKGIPIVGKIDYNVAMWNSIPFIPTSSALCVGHGQQNPTPNIFTQNPDIDNTPFGSNVYKFIGLSSKHIDLSPPNA